MIELMYLSVYDCSCQKSFRARSLDLSRIFLVVLPEPWIRGYSSEPCHFFHSSKVYVTCW